MQINASVTSTGEHLWKDEEKILIALRISAEDDLNSTKSHEVLWHKIAIQLNKEISISDGKVKKNV